MLTKYTISLNTIIANKHQHPFHLSVYGTKIVTAFREYRTAESAQL